MLEKSLKMEKLSSETPGPNSELGDENKKKFFRLRKKVENNQHLLRKAFLLVDSYFLQQAYCLLIVKIAPDMLRK